MGEKWVGGPAVEGCGGLFIFSSLSNGKKKNFAGATAPLSHYVAPPLSLIKVYYLPIKKGIHLW